MIEWRPINSLGGVYEAGSDGNIRSVKRSTTKGGIIMQHVNKRNGYCYISTSYKGVLKTQRVHKLIAEAFFGPREEGQQINHIDGDKTNNRPDNLEYCTQSHNMRHAFATGLEKRKGLKVIDLDTGAVYETATDAARAIGAPRPKNILMNCRGQRSHYRGHHYALFEDYLNGTIPKYKGKCKKGVCEKVWR